MIRRRHLDADDEWREDYWADLRDAAQEASRFAPDNRPDPSDIQPEDIEDTP